MTNTHTNIESTIVLSFTICSVSIAFLDTLFHPETNLGVSAGTVVGLVVLALLFNATILYLVIRLALRVYGRPVSISRWGYLGFLGLGAALAALAFLPSFRHWPTIVEFLYVFGLLPLCAFTLTLLILRRCNEFQK